MALTIGDDAPDFTAETTEGPISFHDWLGDSWGVLFSHPRDFTPVCSTELGYMASIKPEFDARNAKIIGLSVDPVGNHEKWAEDIEAITGHGPELPGHRRRRLRGRQGLRHAARRRRGRGHRAHAGPEPDAPQRLRRRARQEDQARARLSDDDRPQLRRGPARDRLAAADRQAPRRDARPVEAGRERDHHRLGLQRGGRAAATRTAGTRRARTSGSCRSPAERLRSSPGGAAAPRAAGEHAAGRRSASSRRVGAARCAALPSVKPAPIIAGVVVLAVLWLVRPIWHGLAMFFWTQPFVWLPPILLLAIGGLLLRRSQRSWSTLEDLRSGVRPPAYLFAFPVIAFFIFVICAGISGPLVGRSIVKNTNYEAIPGLPAGGKVRLVPREVAEVNASSAFNSPTETLTNFRIVNTDTGLVWTALRTPQGAFRIFSKKSQGIVELPAEQTARSLKYVDAELKYAPGLQITDNLRWRLLKERFLINLEEPVGIETPQGARMHRPLPRVQGLAHPPAGARRRLRRRARRDDRGPRARGGGQASRARGDRPDLPRHAGAPHPGGLPVQGRHLERVVRAREPDPDHRHRDATASPTSSTSARPAWATSGCPWPSRTAARSPRARSSSPTRRPARRGSGACRREPR